MPALVNNRLGESGIKLEEGTIVCCFDLKKSRKDWRISLLVIVRAVGCHAASPGGKGVKLYSSQAIVEPESNPIQRNEIDRAKNKKGGPCGPPCGKLIPIRGGQYSERPFSPGSGIG
jgi:hypothetical protein